ncbi:hypothetical protein AB4Y85_17125 [Microvirga sp. 2YAF29]|uniref:hypothetical protein n=1 Tax=Microvirga sp. 2YAF29 TaxID=3233031 RepID=UPI003F97E999
MARAGLAEWDEEDALDYERPSRHARKRRLPWFRVTLMSSLTVATLAYFAPRKGPDEKPASQRQGVPVSVLTAPAPMWNPLPQAAMLYGFEKSTLPVTFEARQHTNGAREDTLVLGRLGDARHARITLLQGSTEPARSFFIDIVRRAAQAGLAVSRNAQSRMVATKFGPLEAAAVTLTGLREQECQAFRLSQNEAGFGFEGWLCGTAPMDEGQLACFLDGLALSGAASPSVKTVFARAEGNRIEACGSAARTASINSKALSGEADPVRRQKMRQSND